MRVVFELSGETAGAVYVVDVQTVDSECLKGTYRGAERSFAIEEIRNATTVSGRPFSLRPYDAAIARPVS